MKKVEKWESGEWKNRKLGEWRNGKVEKEMGKWKNGKLVNGFE